MCKSANNIFSNLMRDIEDNDQIETYHQNFEATISLSDPEEEWFLLALHEFEFEVIKETETIYTIKYDSAETDTKYQITDDIVG